MKPPPACGAVSVALERRPAGVGLLFCLTACLCSAAPAKADRPAWQRYEVAIWQKQNPAQYRALKALGVTAGMVKARRDDGPGEPVDRPTADLLSQAGLGCYIENIATDFYSAYHIWTPNKPVNWRFLDAQARFAANPADPTAFIRDPSLSDPAWLAKINLRLERVVKAEDSEKPLYYSLGDETGIGDLAAYWDFDLSSYSIDGMRDWLRLRYPSLPALNAEWNTRYRDWSEIRPMTMPEAMQRNGNYAPWADFKAWMDFAFAHALATATATVHAASPAGRSGIEGAQIPGWGGYDYSRLANAVDVMEIYDNDANVEMARSFNPDLVLLTTAADHGPKELNVIWRELLKGGGGLVLWDENNEIARPDGSLGPRGLELRPVLRKIEGADGDEGIGPLLLRSARVYDPIAILYSPASFRTHWMLEWKDKGDAWSKRDAAAEYDPDEIRQAPLHFLDAVEHLGFQPRFISSAGLAQGILERDGYKVLILPRAIALSTAEAARIRLFVKKGGIVIADEEPGLYDEHSRKLAAPALHDLFVGKAERAILVEPQSEKLAEITAAAGLKPRFPLSVAKGGAPTDARTYVFRDGAREIVAIHRDFPASGDAPPETITVALPKPAYMFDLIRGTALGRTDRATLELDSVTPEILVVSDRPGSPD
ncbi:MAG TPA: alpha-amylase family protein [Alphaproteobacteria bacterium]|nr:alpha-amylase family protein [Alphaproteobacteria bacterium]